MGRTGSSSALAFALVLSGCALSGNDRRAGPSGLWMGSLQLCEATVESAVVTHDHLTGEPALLVTLKPGARRDFARLTARAVGRSLAIRLDGRTLSEPVVREPLLGGQVQVTGIDPAIPAAAAKGPC